MDLVVQQHVGTLISQQPQQWAWGWRGQLCECAASCTFHAYMLIFDPHSSHVLQNKGSKGLMFLPIILDIISNSL